ncbi:MAG: penicillin-binding protein 1A [Hyphomicrobiales bacterium]|nr:penicillin-binding protein 1A [Hyphomicrobiales bacterium]
MRLLGWMIATGAVCLLIALMAIVGIIQRYGSELPDYHRLANYEPPVATRVYTGDGRLLAEYATENRVFVPIDSIPDSVINAFVSAEDKHFFSHQGIDPLGIVRAVWTNLKYYGSDRRPVGASTITQQVAKNFLLTNEVSITRKIREAILAFRMSQTFTKERVLELYLNEIYLGQGTYGVAAAALNYFDKALSDLTLGEAAFLAALPKAPNNYDPRYHPEAAKSRRDWVIARLLEDGHISRSEAEAVWGTPITTRKRRTTDTVTAKFFAEEIRREIAHRFDDKALYEGGLVVHATIVPQLQEFADRAMKNGLEAYDRRHGWRGPIAKAQGSYGPEWFELLDKISLRADVIGNLVAAVTNVNTAGADIVFSDGKMGRVPFETMRWARSWLPGQRVGPAPQTPSDVLDVGDVIAVEADENGAYALYQIPAIDGALVALDPHTGRVLAMSGGLSYERSEFNRATQARRQPGSAFKPIVYLAAMEAGLTPATVIMDAPIVIEQGPGLPPWSPSNYTNKFYGPTTLRVGLEKSLNVMTVRLANDIGMANVADAAQRLGIFDHMPPYLANALGAGETTLMRLTSAYATLINGGRGIQPQLIDRIQDRYGHTVFREDQRPCPDCRAFEWLDQPVPELPEWRPQRTDPHSAYQVVSMLEGVVQRGTGRRVGALNRPLAGKTGTSNDSKDTWFIGFSPDLVVGVFVGFDEPQSLGPKETGASTAAPIFSEFMAAALADAPAIPFRIPPGIRLVRVNAQTGRPTHARGPGVILEGFKPGTIPSPSDDFNNRDLSVGAPSGGTGGLY